MIFLGDKFDVYENNMIFIFFSKVVACSHHAIYGTALNGCQMKGSNAHKRKPADPHGQAGYF